METDEEDVSKASQSAKKRKEMGLHSDGKRNTYLTGKSKWARVRHVIRSDEAIW